MGEEALGRETPWREAFGGGKPGQMENYVPYPSGPFNQSASFCLWWGQFYGLVYYCYTCLVFKG